MKFFTCILIVISCFSNIYSMDIEGDSAACDWQLSPVSIPHSLDNSQALSLCNKCCACQFKNIYTFYVKKGRSYEDTHKIYLHYITQHINYLKTLICDLGYWKHIPNNPLDDLKEIFNDFDWIIENKNMSIFNNNKPHHLEPDFHKNLYILYNKLQNKYFEIEDSKLLPKEILEYFKCNCDKLLIKLALIGNSFLFHSLNHLMVKLSKKEQKQILEELEMQGIVL